MLTYHDPAAWTAMDDAAALQSMSMSLPNMWAEYTALELDRYVNVEAPEAGDMA